MLPPFCKKKWLSSRENVLTEANGFCPDFLSVPAEKVWIMVRITARRITENGQFANPCCPELPAVLRNQHVEHSVIQMHLGTAINSFHEQQTRSR